MKFFIEKRNYIMCFILFGLWTSWKNSFKHRILFQMYSIFVTALVLYAYCMECISDQNFKHVTLLSTLTVSLSIVIFSAYLIIAMESVYKSMAQELLIQKISTIDRFFITKMGIYIPYKKEKRRLFVQNITIVAILLFLTFSVLTYSYYNNSIMYSVNTSVAICIFDASSFEFDQ